MQDVFCVAFLKNKFTITNVKNKANQRHSSLHTHFTLVKRDDTASLGSVMFLRALTAKRSGRIALAPFYFLCYSDAFLVLSTEPVPELHSKFTQQKAPAAIWRTPDTSAGLMMLSNHTQQEAYTNSDFLHREQESTRPCSPSQLSHLTSNEIREPSGLTPGTGKTGRGQTFPLSMNSLSLRSFLLSSTCLIFYYKLVI